MDNVNTYFSGLEVFKTLRFEIVKALESSGRDADTFKKEYDEFSDAQSQLISDHMKISTGSLPLKIGIVGSFSTGKSLMINSLIGSELLGIADKASTCKVTILSYRNIASPQIYKMAEDSQPIEVAYEEYLKFSMHDEDEADNLPNEKVHFEIYHPATVLKDFQIIDTPGFSSLSRSDDEITKEYLKKADVLLWVFDATRGAIDEKEKAILQGLPNKRIIGVVNRIDMLPPSQRPRVLQSYTEGHEFSKTTPYSALSSLKYQKDIQFNNQVYEKVKSKLAEFMLGTRSLNIERQQNNLCITSNDNILFESQLKETGEEDEEIQYHFSLLNILKEIRQEISSIKRELFIDELKDFHDRELSYWQSQRKDLEDVITSSTRTYNEFNESLINLSKKIIERAEKHFEVLQKNPVDKIFDSLYEFEYEDGGWLGTSKYYFIKKDVSDNFESIGKILYSEFNAFQKKLVGDLKKGLDDLEINIDDVYDADVINTLNYTVQQAAINSIASNYNIVQEYVLGVSTDRVREIVKGGLKYLIFAEPFKDLALNYLRNVLVNIANHRETLYERDKMIFTNLLETITQSIHE